MQKIEMYTSQPSWDPSALIESTESHVSGMKSDAQNEPYPWYQMQFDIMRAARNQNTASLTRDGSYSSCGSPSEISTPYRMNSLESSRSSSTSSPAQQPNLKPQNRLTEKQLRRRMQNPISQQTVRRRRNRPARKLETRLQELDEEHKDLRDLYAENIESCIETLMEEIRTLRAIQVVLGRGNSVPPQFECAIESDLFLNGLDGSCNEREGNSKSGLGLDPVEGRS